jgi:pimeloyl-ACP methyl ester carboxylesterase
MAKTKIVASAITKPCLLIVRSEAESEAQLLADEIAAAGVVPALDVRTLAGTTDLLDTDAELAVLPEAILHEIATWTAGRAGPPFAPRPVRPQCRRSAGEARDGVVLHHRATRIGPAQLLAVETVRADAAPTRAVVAVNNGVARSIGPGRAWVEFGDELARAGWRVMRVDLSGLGDSPLRPGRIENDSYSPSAADDLADVTAFLRADGVDEIVLLGLCSGAFVGFDAVLAGARIDTLVCINGRYDKPFHDRRNDRSRRAAGQTNRLLSIPLNKTPLLPFFEKVPTWIWRSLDRLHLVASPTIAFEKVLARGVRVFMVFGTGEWGLGALRQRGGRRFNEITQNPLATLVEVPGLDHSMFDITRRDTVKAHVRGYLTDLGTGGRAPALGRD